MQCLNYTLANFNSLHLVFVCMHSVCIHISSAIASILVNDCEADSIIWLTTCCMFDVQEHHSKIAQCWIHYGVVIQGRRSTCSYHQSPVSSLYTEKVREPEDEATIALVCIVMQPFLFCIIF